MTRTLTIAAGIAAMAASVTALQVIKVDSGIAAYQKTSGVSGSVNSIGSDSMNNLMTLWAE
ncbi:MAG TPA: hypothetical protein VF424_05345, partial [Vicinamibacterales bacterium]